MIFYIQQELTLKQCEIDALTSKISGLETALQGARESSTEAIQRKIDELNDFMERQEVSHNKQLETFEQNELQLRQGKYKKEHEGVYCDCISELASLEKYHATETDKMEKTHRKELQDAVEQAVKELPTHSQLEQVIVNTVFSLQNILFDFIVRNSLGSHARRSVAIRSGPISRSRGESLAQRRT